MTVIDDTLLSLILRYYVESFDVLEHGILSMFYFTRVSGHRRLSETLARTLLGDKCLVPAINNLIEGEHNNVFLDFIDWNYCHEFLTHNYANYCSKVVKLELAVSMITESNLTTIGLCFQSLTLLDLTTYLIPNPDAQDFLFPRSLSQLSHLDLKYPGPHIKFEGCVLPASDLDLFHLSSLTYLSIHGYELGDLFGLDNLPFLTYLSINGSEVSALDKGVHPSAKLSHVDVGSFSIPKLSLLGPFLHLLSSLHVSKADVFVYEKILGMRNLERLFLTETTIKVIDLSHFPFLTEFGLHLPNNLVELVLNGCERLYKLDFCGLDSATILIASVISVRELIVSEVAINLIDQLVSSCPLLLNLEVNDVPVHRLQSGSNTLQSNSVLSQLDNTNHGVSTFCHLKTNCFQSLNFHSNIFPTVKSLIIDFLEVKRFTSFIANPQNFIQNFQNLKSLSLSTNLKFYNFHVIPSLGLLPCSLTRFFYKGPFTSIFESLGFIEKLKFVCIKVNDEDHVDVMEIQKNNFMRNFPRVCVV
ncbi:hypothetical protein RCL1_004763 [Eukaryota sp. TZLM3-RCL]